MNELLTEGWVEQTSRWLGYLFILYAVVSPVSISATNIVLGLIIISGFSIVLKARGENKIRFPERPLILLSLLFLWAAATRIFAGGSFHIDAVSNIWEYSPIILLPMILSVSKIRKDRTILALLISSSVVCILGLIQYLIPAVVYPFPRQLALSNSGGFYFQGFFSNRLHTGGFYSITLILPVAFILFWECSRRNKLFLWLFFLLNVVALSLSMTRSYYISVSITLMTLLLMKSRRWFVAGIIAITVLLALILSFPNPINKRLQTLTNPDFSSNKQRIYIWKAAIEMIKDHPLVGVGSGNWKKEAKGHYFPIIEKKYNHVFHAYSHAHNIYLTRLAETGIIGLFLFMLFWLSVAWALFTGSAGLQQGSFEHALTFGVLGSLGNLFIAGLFENNFGTSVVLLLMSFLIGISLDSPACNDLPRVSGDL